ncbi:MAG: hypothetical protein AAFW64_07850 [Pseudomonadota bacterium]
MERREFSPPSRAVFLVPSDFLTEGADGLGVADAEDLKSAGFAPIRHRHVR